MSLTKSFFCILKIDFAYETSAPGKVVVTVSALVAGKPIGSFGCTPFDLTEEAGKGFVFVVNAGYNDEIIDEFRLMLVPKGGPQSSRVAATILRSTWRPFWAPGTSANAARTSSPTS